jgi:hypothetical protein
MIGKISSGMLVVLFTVCMLALFSNVRTAQAQTPRMWATPNPKTLKLASSPAPPYPRYNFSIMVENLPRVYVIDCDLRWNTTAVNITAYYPGALQQLGFDTWIWADWFPTSGYINALTAAKIGGSVDIVAPVEVFKIEVECRALTPEGGTLIDISNQDAWDIDLNQLLSGDCPCDHNLYVKLSSTVGGVQVPIDKLSLLAPSIGIATAALTAVAATAIYAKRFKRKKEKQ